ncbi:MAG: hypothetical protein M1834_008942 [Cirrosporium novae-zelandiae]|nr:MAG: hypothetical protein M1834_008942 [Cirrosporium novae-zelandiae]
MLKMRNIFHLTLISLLSFLASSTCANLIPFDDWEHQRVQLQDVSIHFRYAGSGSPVLLVHGWPQHSLTWHTIGPILAQNYTVIAVDIRGCGDSSIPANNDYTASTGAEDLKGVLDFLGINQTYVFSHDKGVGLAAALATKYPSYVKRIGFADYPLPGFGYETFQIPTADWDLYSNWQLAFFQVPDAAEFFISGKEKQMLAWYFYHSSYSGNAAISEDYLNRYTTAISKPGFLRSGLTYFGVSFQDEAFFNSTIKQNPLSMPVLALGGEASFPLSVLKSTFSTVGRNVTVELIPKAGHWIGDENPKWTGNRVSRFLAEDGGIPTVDLGYLTDKVTLG